MENPMLYRVTAFGGENPCDWFFRVSRDFSWQDTYKTAVDVASEKLSAAPNSLKVSFICDLEDL